MGGSAAAQDVVTGLATPVSAPRIAVEHLRRQACLKPHRLVLLGAWAGVHSSFAARPRVRRRALLQPYSWLRPGRREAHSSTSGAGVKRGDQGRGPPVHAGLPARMAGGGPASRTLFPASNQGAPKGGGRARSSVGTGRRASGGRGSWRSASTAGEW